MILWHIHCSIAACCFACPSMFPSCKELLVLCPWNLPYEIPKTPKIPSQICWKSEVKTCSWDYLPAVIQHGAKMSQTKWDLTPTCRSKLGIEAWRVIKKITNMHKKTWKCETLCVSSGQDWRSTSQTKGPPSNRPFPWSRSWHMGC